MTDLKTLTPVDRFDFCTRCDESRRIEDEFDEQIGYEERARYVRVIALECGHCIELPRSAS